ncbi:fibronectin type III domain-containing protein [Fulvivirgaceae bacterium BMA12]|uniref:Fibronectin type III domain-containing protein n=1 Tax=Agaribacillus aureus TaxID=3051825 RepID=A0ABT8LC59_9BACT|nr:fibronectin type III domain-containing protein [Fulvivirgaceae bacterium BMA12]
MNDFFKKPILLFGVIVCLVSLQAQSQELEIAPYLQDAEPNEITIKWQTDTGEESVVEYGLSPKLGKKASGKSFGINFSKAILHEVRLSKLKRFTTYYYRVKTGKTKSDIFEFKTPPFSQDNKKFNLLAMSDMQRDWQYPDKFSEVVNGGIIPYMEKNYGKKLPDHLAMILIPGDLVVNGEVFDQWENEFFKPAAKIFNQVPVYPAIGNHEKNSQFYFDYFSLPQNGSAAHPEHWWYKDYSNVRIIGLDSNDGYKDSPLQINWLENLLQETGKNENIDFVFAELHHPHKSELWIPGEEEFSAKVVSLLENFTQKTGKPSIHFFGHTHGYSRGQSKDHKHLMVNVASAGGAIDNWGEFEGRDYEEFTVTQDEYGFVILEVEADQKNPKFTLKRISQGNYADGLRDNEIRDSITIFKNPIKPQAPESISPNNETLPINGVVLKAGTFQSKSQKTFHAASNWQVATDPGFEKPVINSWKQFENWYYKENRQKNDDLSDEKLHRLAPNTTYYWRVRYRDQNLNWSDWSKIQTFKTQGKAD